MILLVIIKTFEIQSYVCGFRFFQESWQNNLEEMLNASNEDELPSLIHDRYAIVCKDKNEQTFVHGAKYVSK